MSGSSTSGPPALPFQDVLEAWGFESWDEAAAWMVGASADELAEFLAALSDGEN